MPYLARPDDSPVTFDEPRETSPAESAAPMDDGPADAVRRLAAAARHGVPEAQAAHAQALPDGRGTRPSPRAASRWFRAAENAGSVEAVDVVGRRHEHGWGTPADPTAATAAPGQRLVPHRESRRPHLRPRPRLRPRRQRPGAGRRDRGGWLRDPSRRPHPARVEQTDMAINGPRGHLPTGHGSPVRLAAVHHDPIRHRADA